MSVSGRVVRGAVLYTLGGYAMQIVGLVFGAILARLIAPADFGVFGLAMAISLFFARIKLWGFNSLIIARTDPDDIEISTQFWLSVGFSAAVLVLVAAVSPLLRMFYGGQVIVMAVAVTALSIFENEGIASTPESLLARELRYGTISLVTLAATVAQLTSTAFFALRGWAANALLGGYAVRVGVYCMGVWILAPRRPRFLFSMERARALIGEGRYMLWGGIGSFLAFQYDDIAVGTISGTPILGLYQKAYNLSLVPMSIVGGVMGVAGATYAQVKDNRQALSEAVSFVLDAVALIVMPASVGLALIAPDFVPLYLGDRWIGAVPMVQLLLVYSMVRPLNDAVGSLAPALKRVHVMTRYGIVQSVVMVVTCTALTLLWGANGAAISAGITVIVGFAIFCRDLLKDSVDVDYRGIFGLPLAAVAVSAAITLVMGWLWTPEMRLAAIVYKGGMFSLVFVAVLLVLGRNTLLARAQRLIHAALGRGEPSSA